MSCRSGTRRTGPSIRGAAGGAAGGGSGGGVGGGGGVDARGACDMKGGVVAILEAVRAVVASGDASRFDGELLVVSVPSEEAGGRGMLAAIRAGATGDVAVITEPSGLDVVIAHAGALTFRLT